VSPGEAEVRVAVGEARRPLEARALEGQLPRQGHAAAEVLEVTARAARLARRREAPVQPRAGGELLAHGLVAALAGRVQALVEDAVAGVAALRALELGEGGVDRGQGPGRDALGHVAQGQEQHDRQGDEREPQARIAELHGAPPPRSA
jgi:hypothetical protein